MKQGWEIKKLGEVADISPSKAELKNIALSSSDDVSFLPMEDLTIGKTYVEPQKVKQLSEVEGSYTYFKEGDILLAKVTPCFENGKLAIAKNLSNGVGFGSSEYIVVRSKMQDVLPTYLLYILQSNNFRTQGKTVMLGACGLKRLPKPFVFNFEIPVPPLPEQEKIVAELDCLSGIIEKKRQQLKELDALAQSIFYEMFGEPLENEKGWGLRKIGDVCQVNPNKKDTSKGLTNSDSVSFLPMEDLPIKACYYQPEKTRTFSEVQSSYTCFADNDVLMAKVTPCFENGKIGIASNLQNGVGYGSSEFIVIRTNNVDVIKEYIYFVIQDALFIENACAQLTGTSGLRRVPRQYVENCNITLPPLHLQQTFASKIEAIEKQKALIKQSIAETETLFNSRMDYYFN